jgi:hypothetical protein
VKLAAEHGHHVNAREGLSLKKDSDVAPFDFYADALFERYRSRLMRRLIDHGCKAEELPWHRLVDDHFLLIVIDRRHTNLAGNQDISRPRAISDLVDTLTRGEALQFDLTRKYC